MPVPKHVTDAERLAQVAAHLQQAISLIAEVAPGVVERLIPGIITPLHPQSLTPDRSNAPSENGSPRPSIIDEAGFSVRWANRICRLGNTVAFRLLKRLAQRPNQFVSCETLLDDVWNDEHTSPEAVRSAVKILRRKLTAAGMKDLAKAINGTSHHYALMLAGR